MNNLSRNITKIRIFNTHRKHYTQKNISEILKIPQTQISRIENGSHPKLDEIIKYSTFFNVSIDDLIFKEYDSKDLKFK